MEEKIRVILKPDGTGRPGIFWKIPDASVSFNLNSELLKCSWNGSPVIEKLKIIC